jgi:hypothetical protein
MQKSLATLLFACALIAGCSKSSNSPKPPASIGFTGYWSGNFDGSIRESELFSSDGTTVQYDFYGSNVTDTAQCPYKAYGTYTITGDSIHFDIVFPTLGESFSENALIDTSVQPYTMSGSFTSPQAAPGTFLFTKQ